MKIAFVDRYGGPGASTRKDPVSIPRELARAGHALTLVDVSGKSAGEPGWARDLRVVTQGRFLNELDGPERPDAAIALTRFDAGLTPLLRALRQHGVPLVVKGDTDGTLGYPLTPNYLRMRPPTSAPLNLLRHLKWRLPLRGVIASRLDHLDMADAVVVESPGARVNVAQFLIHHGRSALLDRLRFLPNPLPMDSQLPDAAPRPCVIVAVGRWNDPAKGAALLRGTLTRALVHLPGYAVHVVGVGAQAVTDTLPIALRKRCTAHAPMPFAGVEELLRSARILLVPSLIESFSFATGEALASGASVAVTPIESLIYLAGGGAHGSIARDFTAPALAAALCAEAAAWEQGARDPVAIARHWRATLDPERIAREWVNIIQCIGA